ncbi:hypothetical protein GCM10011571_06720 [Marinithermofilum abyssi]|uniref:Tetratricopeptide repeat protein n=1 Tax=Marinithermofilum abyssi TaxID=1571185 RepID=A0A8J2VCI6_9BACL|nr:hypothetical protein [Marinithermofilum abyssi]GGE08128.1 hypothetical protein GCM10011571_06720 [Marinithermofilum abyssi]
MTQLDQLKSEAATRVSHLLPNQTFQQFEDLNTRMLIAVTCMHHGHKELAYKLFATIAEAGPQENENRHFAYVRSLAEMAEIEAERGDFADAEVHMAEALREYPESMNYMMSRVHLEVYLTYYRFQAGKKEEAFRELRSIIERETRRFHAADSPEDGRNLVGPGLCYAIHQLALFHAEEGNWERAVKTFQEMRPFANEIDPDKWDEAASLTEQGRWEDAFHLLTSSVSYEAP